LNNETITIEVPQKQIQMTGSIFQPLLGYQDKPKSMQSIREEHDARKLRQEENKEVKRI
jgi:hypothetical protein